MVMKEFSDYRIGIVSAINSRSTNQVIYLSKLVNSYDELLELELLIKRYRISYCPDSVSEVKEIFNRRDLEFRERICR